MDEIEIDAEFAVGTRYNIKANQLMADAELALKAIVTAGLTARINLEGNLIRNAKIALLAAEAVASGRIDWDIIGTDAADGEPGGTGIDLDFAAGGTKHIEGGNVSGFGEGNLKINEMVGPGVLADLEINAGIYNNSGRGGANPQPGIRGQFQASARFPVDIIGITSNDNTADGIAFPWCRASAGA